LEAAISRTSSLEDNLQQLEAICAESRDLLADLTDAEVNWQPAPNRWSIGQCVSHLIVSGRAELPYLESAIREGRKRRLFGKEPFQYGFLGNWFVRSMDANGNLRFRAPKIYWPADNGFNIEVLTRDFLSLQDKLRQCLMEADGLNWARVRVSTPVSRFITFSLGQEFALILAHERRHLSQAGKIKKLRSPTAL